MSPFCTKKLHELHTAGSTLLILSLKCSLSAQTDYETFSLGPAVVILL